MHLCDIRTCMAVQMPRSLYVPCGNDAILPPDSIASADAPSVSDASISELILPCVLHIMYSFTPADVEDLKTLDRWSVSKVKRAADMTHTVRLSTGAFVLSFLLVSSSLLSHAISVLIALPAFVIPFNFPAFPVLLWMQIHQIKRTQPLVDNSQISRAHKALNVIQLHYLHIRPFHSTRRF